jgi:nickel-type superoxide dismutase maturation protease
MGEGIPNAGLIDWIRLVFGRVHGVRVEGDSMSPVLQPGDRVLVDPKASLEPGDVILARHPFRSSVRILKRLRSFEPNGRVFIAGDNPDESTDSRTLGTIKSSDLLGKVVARLKNDA